MSELKDRALRWFRTQQAFLILWTVIALGIIPAVVTGHISPLTGFTSGFGPEITKFEFLPWFASLLILIFAVAISVAQHRFLLLVLLLPWLALVFYTPEQLTFRMPTPWEAQDKLYENEKLALETGTNELNQREKVHEDIDGSKGDESPQGQQALDIDLVRDGINKIRYVDTGVFPTIDLDTLRARLQAIETEFNQPQPENGKQAFVIAEQIATLSAQIHETQMHLDKLANSLENESFMSLVSLGFSDKARTDALIAGRETVTQRLGKLISERNKQRINLEQVWEGTAFADLRKLHAEVLTYVWASESYHAGRASLVYKVLSLTVLLALVWRFSLGSWMYLGLLGAALLTALVVVDVPVMVFLWSLLQFVLLSLLIRIAYLVYLENAPLVLRQPRAFLKSVCQKTLIYYLPFAVLIIGGVVSSVYINRQIEQSLYQWEFMRDADPEVPLRYNIDQAIDIHFAEKEEAAFAALDGLSNQTTTAEVVKIVMTSFDDTIVEELKEIEPELEPPNCNGFLPWVFDTPDCAKRSVTKPINDTYTEKRNQERARLDRATQGYQRAVDEGLGSAVEFARRDLSETFLAMKSAVKKQLGIVYAIIDFYALVSLMLLVLFAVKSLMYIFSRIFFGVRDNSHFDSTSDKERAIQFESIAEVNQRGQIKEVSDKLELTLDMGEFFYINKRHDFANAPPDEVTPQAHKAFFSRYRFGAWHLNRIWARAKGESSVPYRRIPADERIVVWTIKPGDAVIFSWRDFVGMSDCIEIRTQYSWQLSSLVFGRLFFVVASVAEDSPRDGTLLLAARSSDGVDENSNPSYSPDQLLSWQTTTRFELHANLSFRNVYRSGIQIRAKDRDLAVMHLSNQRQSTGAGKFLKYFLVPI